MAGDGWREWRAGSGVGQGWGRVGSSEGRRKLRTNEEDRERISEKRMIGWCNVIKVRWRVHQGRQGLSTHQRLQGSHGRWELRRGHYMCWRLRVCYWTERFRKKKHQFEGLRMGWSMDKINKYHSITQRSRGCHWLKPGQSNGSLLSVSLHLQVPASVLLQVHITFKSAVVHLNYLLPKQKYWQEVLKQGPLPSTTQRPT